MEHVDSYKENITEIENNAKNNGKGNDGYFFKTQKDKEIQNREGKLGFGGHVAGRDAERWNTKITQWRS